MSGFHGLVYWIDVPKVDVLTFCSGKIVVTDGKKPTDAEDVVDRIVKELECCTLL